MNKKIKRYQHPLYSRWRVIRYHTTDERSPRWEAYGGRGIKMKPQWERDFWSFAEWVEENIGLPSSSEDYLDRKNNDKGYYPGNICWATAKENSRRSRVNTRIKIAGETRCLCEWSEITGIQVATVLGRRSRGLSWEQVFEYKPHPRVRVRHYQWK